MVGGALWMVGKRCCTIFVRFMGWFLVSERVDRTNAERQRRSRERKRFEKLRVTQGVTLSEAAAAAEREAIDELGPDFDRYASAVRRYVLAVDVGEHARLEWERLERPMRDTFANGMSGVHPVLRGYEAAEAQAGAVRRRVGVDAGECEADQPCASSWPADRRDQCAGSGCAAWAALAGRRATAVGAGRATRNGDEGGGDQPGSRPRGGLRSSPGWLDLAAVEG